MHHPKYSALTNTSKDTFEFLSSGPQGSIKKIVFFQELPNYPGVYNLAFGDWDEIEQKVKDNTRSNNGDRDKVLATVASTVFEFMKSHPTAILFAKGETPAKTRLYQMGINANWKEINASFIVDGFTNGSWELVKAGKNYEAFMLRQK